MMAGLAALGLAAGCTPAAQLSEIESEFVGFVAADEPRAALEAREILAEGGSAADAAASMFFTLAVTLPTSAGLSAGGACLVFDPAAKRFEQLAFHSLPSSGGANAVALPVGPRAMAALHARHGRHPLAQIVGRAERIARFGEPVSRQLAAELAAAQAQGARLDGLAGILGGDPASVRGRRLVRPRLAALLGRLRARGVGELYQGEVARRLIADAGRAGFAIDPDRLRRALPHWRPVAAARHDHHDWAVVAARADDGEAMQRLLAAALAGPAAGRMAPADALHALAGTVRDRGGPDEGRFTAGDAAAVPETVSPGAASFMAVDRAGLAVGCAIGLNAPAGTGVLAGDLGLLLAPPPPAEPDGALALALLVGNSFVGQTHLAATGSGGRAASSALLSAVLGHYAGDLSLERAVGAPRAHPATGSLAIEAAMPPALRSALRGRGHRLAETPAIGQVRLFRCAEGIPKSDYDCGMADDRRGGGLGLLATGGS